MHSRTTGNPGYHGRGYSRFIGGGKTPSSFSTASTKRRGFSIEKVFIYMAIIIGILMVTGLIFVTIFKKKNEVRISDER